MIDNSPQRAFALEVVTKLRAAGFETYWAGGCVRDQLLGITPDDYDVATSAKPEEIRNVFGHRRTLAIGASFGVITVLGRRAANEGQIDVATFRTDAEYSDGRRPDAVHFTTAEHDAERRDFTINGLFFDPITNEIVDYVGGREDLERRIVRAIGDPHHRITEDKLRMLRAVRFAATFDFAIDPATLTAIQAMADQVTTVSAERIGAELRRMLLGPNRAAALDLLQDAKLLPYVLSEVAGLNESNFAETRRILASLDSPTLPLALAALLSHVSDADAASTVGRRLRYTNKDIERTAWLLAHRATLANAPHEPWPRLQRVLVHHGAPELILLHTAVAGPAAPALAFVAECLAWPPEKLNPPPLVDGSDLIHHGLAPGPEFSRLLELARDAQLNGEIETTAGALNLVQRILAGDDPRGIDGQS
jgi:tRNA nucleotidyltransferase/poly(A) polymerase